MMCLVDLHMVSTQHKGVTVLHLETRREAWTGFCLPKSLTNLRGRSWPYGNKQPRSITRSKRGHADSQCTVTVTLIRLRLVNIIRPSPSFPLLILRASRITSSWSLPKPPAQVNTHFMLLGLLPYHTLHSPFFSFCGVEGTILRSQWKQRPRLYSPP